MPWIVLFVRQQNPSRLFVMVNCIFETNVLIVITKPPYWCIIVSMIIIVSHHIWDFSWTTITVRWAGNGPWTWFPLPVVHLFNAPASECRRWNSSDRLDAFSLIYNILFIRRDQRCFKNILIVSILYCRFTTHVFLILLFICVSVRTAGIILSDRTVTCPKRLTR